MYMYKDYDYVYCNVRNEKIIAQIVNCDENDDLQPYNCMIVEHNSNRDICAGWFYANSIIGKIEGNRIVNKGAFYAFEF